MHGPYMIPRPDVPPLGTGLMPAKGPLGRLRDRSAAAVALAVFRSGMPTLNRARAEAGAAAGAGPARPDGPGRPGTGLLQPELRLRLRLGA